MCIPRRISKYIRRIKRCSEHKGVLIQTRNPIWVIYLSRAAQHTGPASRLFLPDIFLSSLADRKYENLTLFRISLIVITHLSAEAHASLSRPPPLARFISPLTQYLNSIVSLINNLSSSTIRPYVCIQCIPPKRRIRLKFNWKLLSQYFRNILHTIADQRLVPTRTHFGLRLIPSQIQSWIPETIVLYFYFSLPNQ